MPVDEGTAVKIERDILSYLDTVKKEREIGRAHV